MNLTKDRINLPFGKYVAGLVQGRRTSESLMKIRQFQLDDYSQVIALWQATGLEVGRSDSLPALRHKLEFDADLLLVAEEGGRIVGVVMGGYDGRRGWIYHLAVAPE